MGYSGAQFDPEKVDLFFESKAGKIQIIENGTAVDYSEAEATKILSEPEVTAINFLFTHLTTPFCLILLV